MIELSSFVKVHCMFQLNNNCASSFVVDILHSCVQPTRADKGHSQQSCAQC